MSSLERNYRHSCKELTSASGIQSGWLHCDPCSDKSVSPQEDQKKTKLLRPMSVGSLKLTRDIT